MCGDEPLNMAPAHQDIVVYQNDTCSFVVDFKDEDGIAVLLTDVTRADLEVRANFGTPVLESFSTITGGIVIVGNEVRVSKIVTLSPGRYRYDLQLTWLGPEIETPLAGYFDVCADITRPV